MPNIWYGSIIINYYIDVTRLRRS